MGAADVFEGGALALSNALNSEVATVATEQFEAAGDKQGLAVVNEWLTLRTELVNKPYFLTPASRSDSPV